MGKWRTVVASFLMSLGTSLRENMNIFMTADPCRKM
jgi:hypothetical protein